MGTATATVDGKPRHVRMKVTPCRVNLGSHPELVLANIGPTTVGYAPPFRLERKTARGWRWINGRQAFNLPLFYLEPGQRSDPESIAVYFSNRHAVELRPGLYRVTKGIDLTPGKPRPPSMVVRAMFRVKG
jgi:hypothetical protein